jgi:hypothetical protein
MDNRYNPEKSRITAIVIAPVRASGFRAGNVFDRGRLLFPANGDWFNVPGLALPSLRFSMKPLRGFGRCVVVFDRLGLAVDRFLRGRRLRAVLLNGQLVFAFEFIDELMIKVERRSKCGDLSIVA